MGNSNFERYGIHFICLAKGIFYNFEFRKYINNHQFLDLNRLCGDHNRENEAYQMHCTFSQTLLKDHFQSTQMSEHTLIQWTEGPVPMLPNNSPASTSQTLL